MCHSDRHFWDGFYEIGGGKELNLVDRGITLPLTMGHEDVGVFTPGGYGMHLLVPHARHLFDIGRLAPQEAAPLACSGVTAYSALKKVVATLHDEPVVIIGAGRVGLMGVALARRMGASEVIAVDIGAAKRDAALNAGLREWSSRRRGSSAAPARRSAAAASRPRHATSSDSGSSS